MMNVGIPAGVKHLAKDGEGSIEQIWPKENALPSYN
jgi:hypothetical protein